MALARGPGEEGLEVLDLSDPRNPQRVSSYPTNILGVQVIDGRAYAWAQASGFMLIEVLDVSRPDDPRRVGGYCPAGGPTGEKKKPSAGVAGNADLTSCKLRSRGPVRTRNEAMATQAPG